MLDRGHAQDLASIEHSNYRVVCVAGQTVLQRTIRRQQVPEQQSVARPRGAAAEDRSHDPRALRSRVEASGTLAEFVGEAARRGRCRLFHRKQPRTSGEVRGTIANLSPGATLRHRSLRVIEKKHGAPFEARH
jgi:hypothetical protein